MNSQSICPDPASHHGHDEFIFLATSDIAARTKGRSMRMADFKPSSSVGWVPANLGIGSLGHIVEGIPYGASGDLRLLPDHSSLRRIEGVPGRPPLNIAFCDIVNTDGSPWESCSRTFLKNVVADLESEFGITVRSAFEHEFQEYGVETDGHPFSLEEFRRAEPMGSTLVTVLERAGLEPENWLPEYGPHQYEVTVAPTDPVGAADRAILVRDIVEDVYVACGRKVTFTPMLTPGGTGNGVHVHLGLQDANGETLIYDADRPGRISELAGSFAAGIVRHTPAFTALFAPLMVSYLRLTPHNWSVARAFLGVQNREALLRICPTNEIDGRDPRPQVHFEFRGADIGANPWLLLGTILRAGLQGLRENLPTPTIVEGEIDLEGAHSDLQDLPRDLKEAVEAFVGDPEVSGWFHPNFVKTFEVVKLAEYEQLIRSSDQEQCDVYARIY
ncbi:MAG: glutamine synthetase family protein [Dermatophilus congolensis]|nr:glutamine synthetase family protein [Dermatophilus congolensis]